MTEDSRTYRARQAARAYMHDDDNIPKNIDESIELEMESDLAEPIESGIFEAKIIEKPAETIKTPRQAPPVGRCPICGWKEYLPVKSQTCRNCGRKVEFK